MFGRRARALASTSPVQLGLDDGTTVHARLLIGADGARSWVREHAGIATTGSDYGQLGIVCNVRTARGHASTAWQRFLRDGPLGMLPLSDGRISIVWSTSESAVQRAMQLDDDDLAGLLSLIQFSALEIHTWNARADRLDRPDQFLFDLDPDERVGWKTVVSSKTVARLRRFPLPSMSSGTTTA